MKPGDLIKLKTPLFWFGNLGDGIDKSPVCHVLKIADTNVLVDASTKAAYGTRNHVRALLLIEGTPHWVALNHEDAEVINDVS